MKVLDFPLVKITIHFIFGILVSYYWKPSLILLFIGLIFSIVGFIIAYLLARKNKSFQFFFGIQTYFLSFFIGMITLLFHTESLQKSNYTNCKSAFEKPHLLTVTIREKLKGNTYNNRYIVKLNSIDTTLFSGKILLNIQKDSTTDPLIIGNIISLKTTLQSNKAIRNPNQFDYATYLKNQQIFAQVYSTKKDLKVSTAIQKDIWYYAAKLHLRIIQNLEKSKFNSTEMNVALALLLGQRQEISSEIIQDYQYSGATHILSVSGLHVGFIMLFITFILKPIPNNKKGALVKLIAILTSLILFAIISGLSPSVLRSVVMFSFLAIGNYLRRRGTIYHTLFVSILLILLFEPYFLFDIGFQLSYLALFFILWLQPVLKKIATPKNKIISYFWDIITVSFAAQIGTLPLCLYYFHQFPGLFFVTNLIVIPLLSIIMILGIIVIILALLDANLLFLVQIFEKSITLLNEIIHYIASFKAFVIQNISFNWYYLLSTYLMIIIFIIWFKKPNFTKFIAVLFATMSLQISVLLTKYETEKTQEMIFYNQRENTLISERKGKNVTLYSNLNKSEFLKNKYINSYLVGNFSTVNKISKIKNTLYFNNNRILIIDSTGQYPEKIHPNIILLVNSPQINFERMLLKLQPEIIVADATNSNLITQKWKQNCAKQNILFHSIKEKGYYGIR